MLLPTLFWGTILALSLNSKVHAHMVQAWPPAMASRYNTLVKEADIDYDVQGPLTGPEEFPCKLQHLKPQTPAATLTAGAEHNITFVKTGASTHNFGSMQVSLSFNNKDFFVIHSWQGQAANPDRNYFFTVPSDTPTGKAVFSWSHINKGGAREFYQACSAVLIAPASKDVKPPTVPFANRPDIFVAQLQHNGCVVPHDYDTIYPEPGPDDAVTTDIVGKSVRMSLDECGPVNGIGNHRRVPRSPTSVFTTSPFVEPPPAQPVVLATPTTLAAHPLPSAQAENVTELVESPDNRCGRNTGYKCSAESCCSYHGWCGSSLEYCGPGLCQVNYGKDCDHSASNPTVSISHLIESPNNQCGSHLGYKCRPGNCCSIHGWCGSSLLYCAAELCQNGYGKECEKPLTTPSSVFNGRKRRWNIKD